MGQKGHHHGVVGELDGRGVRFLTCGCAHQCLSGDQVTVRIDRRACSLVLRHADTAVPWWHGRTLHFEFS